MSLCMHSKQIINHSFPLSVYLLPEENVDLLLCTDVQKYKITSDQLISCFTHSRNHSQYFWNRVLTGRATELMYRFENHVLTADSHVLRLQCTRRGWSHVTRWSCAWRHFRCCLPSSHTCALCHTPHCALFHSSAGCIIPVYVLTRFRPLFWWNVTVKRVEFMFRVLNIRVQIVSGGLLFWLRIFVDLSRLFRKIPGHLLMPGHGVFLPQHFIQSYLALQLYCEASRTHRQQDCTSQVQKRIP